MPQFAPPLSTQDRSWIRLRERLASVARELHFVAISNDAANNPLLLAIAGRFAALAMSIPMGPMEETFGDPADVSPLAATSGTACSDAGRRAARAA